MFDFSSPIRPPHRKLLPLIVKEQTPMSNFSNHLDELSSVVNGWPEWKRNIFGKYKEQSPMTQQFNTINDALKWCIDHPGQRCRDGEGREIWFLGDSESDSSLRFCTNMDSDGSMARYDEFNLFPSDLKHFDLASLRPVEAEPEKPTLGNLAALENWDWVVITLPGGSNQYIYKLSRWTAINYSEVKTALSAGWPVEFGRNEA